MEKFTQKWAIISLLENAPEGYEFYYTEFPLHVTLAGVFKTDKNGAWLAKELSMLLDGQQSFEIEADDKAMFGPNQDIAVTKIKKTTVIMDIYQKIHTWLQKSGAVYNEPNYQGNGYLPHCTFQKSGTLQPREKKYLKSVSIIDLFPNNNGYQRKIYKTFDLL